MPALWCSDEARANWALVSSPSLVRIWASPSSWVWLRESTVTICPFRKETAMMSCWPWTVRMPVFCCWEIICRISGSLKTSRVPSTAISDLVLPLQAKPGPEPEHQPYDRHDPRSDVARIIPPRDAISDPLEERKHQETQRKEERA